MGLLHCLLYIAAMGVTSFLLGRLLPKKWFDSRAFPYASFPFEKKGKIYEKLKIKKWQNKLPDMSRILPGLIPAKRISARPNAETLQQMLQETCVAEFTHFLLCIGGMYCLRLWQGPGGVIVAVLNALIGNIPFILIQRYNRPRLQKLLDRFCSAPNAEHERRQVWCES